MSSRARHPSTCAADTGERVRKYLAISLVLKCLLMYSCPSSSSHHAILFAAKWGPWLGGFFARRSSMLLGAAQGVRSEVIACLALHCAHSIQKRVEKGFFEKQKGGVSKKPLLPTGFTAAADSQRLVQKRNGASDGTEVRYSLLHFSPAWPLKRLHAARCTGHTAEVQQKTDTCTFAALKSSPHATLPGSFLQILVACDGAPDVMVSGSPLHGTLLPCLR